MPTDSRDSSNLTAYLLFCVLRLGCFLQAVVEERPVEESDIFVPAEGALGSRGEGRLTPLHLTWEELAFRKTGLRVYEHSGGKPTPRSTFTLRYGTCLKLSQNTRTETRRVTWRQTLTERIDDFL